MAPHGQSSKIDPSPQNELTTRHLEKKKGLRGQDLNLRPSGYEPDELPGCSTPRQRLGAVGSITTALLKRKFSVLGRPGDDLLSHVLRQSTIGAKAFDGRVRDGIGSYHLAKATRPAKNGEAKLVFLVFIEPKRSCALNRSISRLGDESNQ